MIDFVARFKYLISFIGSVLVALAPSVYQEIKESHAMSKVQFIYSISKDCGALLLKNTYPYYCSVESVKKKYVEGVEKKYTEKGYTVKSIMGQNKVNIPVEIASAMIASIHKASINLIGKPYIARFDIINNTQESIVVEGITITSDDAYDEPLWGFTSSYSINSSGKIKISKISCNGYIVSFENNRIVVPEKNTLSVIIAFKAEPYVKFDNSFIVFTNGGMKKTVKLSEKGPKGNLHYKLHFTVTMATTFILILGIGYMVNHVRTYLKEVRGRQ